jgi:hypothetical protein
MKKLIDFFKSLFGFSNTNKKIDDDFEEQLQWLSSSKKVDDVNKTAFKALLNQDDFIENQVHPYEQELISECQEVHAAIGNYYSSKLRDEHGDLVQIIAMIDQNPEILSSNLGPESVRSKLETEIAQKDYEAKRLVRELEDAEKTLHIFKRANGLNRSPEFIDKKNGIYILLGVAIVEAIVNAVFLRHSLNFNTALVIALIFSGLMVVGNAVFGYQHRETNHNDPIRKKKGEFYKFYAIALILVIASVLCYLRIGGVLSSDMQKQQFLYVETFGLFLASIALGIAAFIKGKQLDDPYPDFSKAGFKVQELSEKISILRTKHAEFYDKVIKETQTQIDSLINTAVGSKQSLLQQLPEMKSIIEKWELDDQKLKLAYANLLKSFKTIIKNNLKINHKYPESIPSLPEDNQLNEYKERFNSLYNNQEGFGQKANTQIKALQLVNSNLSKWTQSPEGQSLRNWL